MKSCQYVVAVEPAELDHLRRDVEPGCALWRMLQDGDGTHLDGLEAVQVLPRIELSLLQNLTS